MPTYGRPQFLHETLMSILGAASVPLEVVVVDDASEPAVAVPAEPRFRVFRQRRNGGPAAARNAGVAAARGRWIGFVDDDDLVTPTRFSAVLPLLDVADIVVCGARFDDGSLHAYGRRQLDGMLLDTLLDEPTPSLGQILVRKELVQPFDEALRTSEDIEWWVRMAGAGRFATTSDVGYVVRRHPEERHGIQSRDRLENRLQVWSKHRGYFDAHPRAAALHAYRIAASAYLLGEHRLARTWAGRSLVRHLNRPSAALLLRELAPSAWLRRRS